MVLFNYAIREITAKLVYYGPGLGGKTTNLQKIHEALDPKTRGKLISLATDADRTLFFDFLPLDLGHIGGYRIRFQLYTVPGQVHYNATRKLVLKGVDALIFVADSQIEMIDRNRESFDNMKENLIENGYDPAIIPTVIQFNKQDLPNVATPEEIAESMGISLADSVIFEAVAVEGKGVFESLKAIVKLTIKKLRKQFEEGQLAGPAPAPVEKQVPKPRIRAAEMKVAETASVETVEPPAVEAAKPEPKLEPEPEPKLEPEPEPKIEPEPEPEVELDEDEEHEEEALPVEEEEADDEELVIEQVPSEEELAAEAAVLSGQELSPGVDGGEEGEEAESIDLESVEDVIDEELVEEDVITFEEETVAPTATFEEPAESAAASRGKVNIFLEEEPAKTIGAEPLGNVSFLERAEGEVQQDPETGAQLWKGAAEEGGAFGFGGAAADTEADAASAEEPVPLSPSWEIAAGGFDEIVQTREEPAAEAEAKEGQEAFREEQPVTPAPAITFADMDADTDEARGEVPETPIVPPAAMVASGPVATAATLSSALGEGTADDRLAAIERSLIDIRVSLEENRILINKMVDIILGRVLTPSPGESEGAGQAPRKRGFLARLLGGPEGG
jgi:signal recognition particle receptor subunit beta